MVSKVSEKFLQLVSVSSNINCVAESATFYNFKVIMPRSHTSIETGRTYWRKRTADKRRKFTILNYNLKVAKEEIKELEKRLASVAEELESTQVLLYQALDICSEYFFINNQFKEENIVLKEEYFQLKDLCAELRRDRKDEKKEFKLERKLLKEKLRNLKERENVHLRLCKTIKDPETNEEIRNNWNFSIEKYKENEDHLSHWITFRDYNKFLQLSEEVEQYINFHGGLNNVIRGNSTKEKISRKRKSSTTPNIREIVAMVLIRSRRGLKVKTIALLYGLSESWVSQLINGILPIIIKFLNYGIGYPERNNLSDYIPVGFKKYFPNSVLLMDCTYIYIEHSKNFSLQYVSFSKHKYRNLLKFLVICLPNGRITEVLGPYGVDDDDDITKKALETSNLSTWLKNGDDLIVDRGFRIGDYLQQKYGVSYHQPAFLNGRKQFSSEEVELSRICASARSVIENDNARIKSQRILQYPFSNKMIPRIKDWIILAASLSNICFKPLRYDIPTAEEERKNCINSDASSIQFPVGARWSSDIQGLTKFPLISRIWIEKRCSIPSISVHFRKSTVERGELYLRNPDPRLKKIYWLTNSDRKILRGRCSPSYSSSNGKKHTAYIEFLTITNDYIPTKSTCDCKNGLSGRCAHVAAVYLKLFYTRNDEYKVLPSENYLDFIETKKIKI